MGNLDNQKPDNTEEPTPQDDAKPESLDGSQPGDEAADDLPWDVIFQHPKFQQTVAKYRKKAKEAEEAAAKLQREREEAERRKLEEQKQFEALYQQEAEKRAELERQLAELQAQRIADRKRAALLDAARQHNPPFRSMADVQDYIAAHSLLDAVEMDDDGNIGDVSKIIDKIANERPHWLATDRNDPGVSGYKPNGAKQPDLEAVKRKYGI